MCYEISVDELVEAVQEIETALDTGQIRLELTGEEISEERILCDVN